MSRNLIILASNMVVHGNRLGSLLLLAAEGPGRVFDNVVWC